MEVQIYLKQFKSYGTKTFTVTTPAPSAPVVVNASRMESTAKKTTSSSSSSSTKKSSGSTAKTSTYKVQIPGMSVLSVSATSVQGAITKACGTSWTGTIYVDGKSYYVVKGVISTKPSATTSTTKSSAVGAAIGAVAGAVAAATTVVGNVLNSIKNAAAKTGTTAKTTTTVSKGVSSNKSTTMVMMN